MEIFLASLRLDGKEFHNLGAVEEKECNFAEVELDSKHMAAS